MVITGRLSLRDDKDPQIVINRARPMSDFEGGIPEEPEEPRYERRDRMPRGPQILPGNTLYLQLASEDDPRYRKVRAIVNMFPGEGVVKVFFADTRKMRGARPAFDSRMVSELRQVLGEQNVVIK